MTGPIQAVSAPIRHMVAADADAVSQLIHRSWVATYGPLMGTDRATQESGKRHQPEMIAGSLVRPHAESFVAQTDEGAIVGYAYAIVVKGVLWLDRLHVAPSHHGTGLAANLMHAVMVNYLGEPAISLEVIKGNDRAIRFYEREGFVVTGETSACGGIGGIASLIMRKPLPRA